MATHHNKGNIMTMVETTRQRLGFKKGDLFEPTPNVRNPHMLEEAEAFSPQLRVFERAVRDYHRHVQGFLGSLLPMLEKNLPRVWTAVSGGLAEPVRSQISHGHPSRIGGDFSTPLILERLELLNRGMEEDILAPLRRWQEGLGIAKERMKSLEGLRRDVDKERRKAEKKFKRQENKLRRAYLGAGYGSSSSSSSDYEDNDYVVPRGRLLEDYQRLALHTERQLNALMESYRDQERLLWEQLSGLVTDAAWLESYAAAAMLKVKETMQAVALALGPCKQPLPAFRHAAYPFDGQYGQIGHNIELLKGFGPRARELASGAKPAGADYLPYTPLRAKRGVSTPLMVGAAAGTGHQQQRLAMEPVPPVQVGASAIPLEAVPTRTRETAIRRVEERAMGSGTRVADMPALPPALTPEPAGATASPLSPLTPSRMAPTAATTMRGSSTAATGGGGYGGSSSALAPVTAGRASNMRTIPEGPTTTTTSTTTVGSSGKGLVAKATEAAGAAAGSVAGAAMAPAAMAAGTVRGAAESFREGVAEGEAAGNRDVTRAELSTERVRGRVSDTATGVSAPVAGRRSSGTTTTAPSSVSTGAAGRGGADMIGNGASGAAGIPRSSGLAGAGPLSAAADVPGSGSSGSSSIRGAGPQPGTQFAAGTAASEAGPMAATGGVTDSSRKSESRGGMSERGAGVSDVTGETPGVPPAAAAAATAAAAAVHDDGMDSFVSALKGPLATGSTSVTGLKHQHHTLAAAPAGYDDPASTYSTSQPSAGYGGEGRLVGGQAQQQQQQQQQGGGGLMGAVKRTMGV